MFIIFHLNFIDYPRKRYRQLRSHNQASALQLRQVQRLNQVNRITRPTFGESELVMRRTVICLPKVCNHQDKPKRTTTAPVRQPMVCYHRKVRSTKFATNHAAANVGRNHGTNTLDRQVSIPITVLRHCSSRTF